MTLPRASLRVVPFLVAALALGGDSPPPLMRGLPPGPHAVGFKILILHSLGRNDYQQESTVLWEYLASHGHVVANVPQLGPSLEDHRLGFDPESLELQAGDIEFALRALARSEGVDGSRIALMGHSSGAVVALLLASRNPSIDAVVGLDGSFSTGEGVALLRAMGWTAPRAPASVLNLYAAGKRDLDLSLLDGLPEGTVRHAAIGTGSPPRQATHFDFQNWPLYAPLVGVDDRRGLSFRSAEAGRELYLEVCRKTREFLEGRFRHSGGKPGRR